MSERLHRLQVRQLLRNNLGAWIAVVAMDREVDGFKNILKKLNQWDLVLHPLWARMRKNERSKDSWGPNLHRQDGEKFIPERRNTGQGTRIGDRS